MSNKRLLFFAALIFSIVGVLPALRAQTAAPRRAFQKQNAQETPLDSLMSPMGRLAYKSTHGSTALGRKTRPVAHVPGAGDTGDTDQNDNCTQFVDGCDAANPPTAASGALAETSIAIDSTGQHIVVGFNDFRGFNLNPVSLSGFMYSDDGGKTFTDGGQLPVTATGQLKDGTAFPDIFGDPDVKYIPGGNGCQFVYSSIMDQGFGTAPNYTSSTQTLGIHRSTDCGHTWTGPFEVTAASNPHGILAQGSPADASDKELMDVDPFSGRVVVSWTNFTNPALISGGTEISTSYSDDLMTADTPSWSPRVIVNPVGSLAGASGSTPRFVGHGSGQLFVAWESIGLGLGFAGRDIFVATSPNKGFDFSDPVRLNRGPIISADYILGNDRVNNFPSIAVDTSPGPFQTNLYVVYASNNNGDGGDVVFQRSVDGGATFSPPIFLNSNPGLDRAQWFPNVAVDSTTGRVSVVYYDQGIATSGDLTELTWIYSDDGGVTWTKPSPLSPQPFHSGYGNDANQPNLGDYIAAVAQGGTVFTAYATTPNQANFTDGQDVAPNGISFPYPNVVVQAGVKAKLALSLGAVTFTDSGANGFIDPNEQIHFQFPLHSYAANPVLGPENLTGVTGTLSTTTPGVTVTKATATYNTINSGTTVSNGSDFIVQTAPNFVAGTKIEFLLTAASPRGTVTLPFTQITGTPGATQIFAEDFESVAPGSLPAGWQAVHAAPVPPARVATPPGYIVPWTTDNSFCGATSNGLFHVNANDGPKLSTPDNTRWERAWSPQIIVPPDSEYVTLDFDICYDTEDDPEFSITDYDGVFLRITDLSTGRTLRSVLTEAFADSIQTGSLSHFPKHFPRNSNPSYFEDMSNWGGFSNGFQHVSMRLPGLAGSTVQLRWEFTQDESGICSDVRFQHSCGVIVDNIVMNSVVSAQEQPKDVSAARAESRRQ